MNTQIIIYSLKILNHIHENNENFEDLAIDDDNENEILEKEDLKNINIFINYDAPFDINNNNKLKIKKMIAYEKKFKPRKRNSDSDNPDKRNKKPINPTKKRKKEGFKKLKNILINYLYCN